MTDRALALTDAARPRIRGRRERARWVTAVCALLLALAVVSGTAIGPVPISLADVLRALVHGLGLPAAALDAGTEHVLVALRLPRIALGVLVGSVLALVGASMQGLFRNALADPGLIGMASGAALAADLVIVFAGHHAAPRGLLLGLLPAAAFGGALVTTLLVWQLARRSRREPTLALLLTGFALSAIANASIGVLSLVADEGQLRSMTLWLLGSLNGASWPVVLACLPAVLATWIALPRVARQLDALQLGEREAGHLGVDVHALRRRVIALSALAVGACVGFTGAIGFVGLIVPHALRLLLGPSHGALFLGSALLGAALLVASDSIARVVIAPAELPIGVVTALVGAPVFLALLLRQERLAL